MKPLFHFADLWKCFVRLFKNTDRVNTEDGSALLVEDNVAVDGNLAVTGEVVAGAESEWQVFENIVDKDGHKRFIEGEGTPNETNPEGLNITFAKWSLSGTHLMIVCAGSIADETIIPTDNIVYFELPEWIHNKIFVQYSAYADTKNVVLYADNYTTQNLGTYLGKWATNISIYVAGVTLTADRKFRIQYDLLID